MWTQFAVTKIAMGARNIGQAPTHTAMPRVTITSPRYIGLRVKRYAPRVISSRLVGEVGLISVSSFRGKLVASHFRSFATLSANKGSHYSIEPFQLFLSTLEIGCAEPFGE